MYISWCSMIQNWRSLPPVPWRLVLNNWYSENCWILSILLVHPNTRKLQEVTFYVAQNDGSVLLSFTTTLALGLIQPPTRLDYLPPRASLITSSVDHPKKTKRVSVHISRSVHSKFQTGGYSAWLTTTCLHIGDKQRANFTKLPRWFCGYWDAFQVPCIIYSWINVLHPNRPLVDQSQCTWKKLFNKRLTRCWKREFLKPVHEATPWINSFVLVEWKDKTGNLKLRICLDSINLNKMIVREPIISRHVRTLLSACRCMYHVCAW